MRIALAAALALALLPLAVATAQDAPAVQKEVLAEGAGEPCGNGRAAVVHYVGTFTDGKEFDSSRKRDEPIVVVVGQGMVIPGWDQTLAQMRKGDRWKVTIPWQLAYGEDGRPPVIPAKADLVFDMELLDVLEPELEYVQRGEGAALEKGDVVETHLTLAPVGGEPFFDTRGKGDGEPGLQSVGRPTGLFGLDMTLSRLRVGDRVKATLPAVLAFGKRGNPPRVPPDTDLTMDLEILRVLAPSIAWLENGDGPQPENGQRVTVHYTGTLPDGTEFDSSREKAKPFRFILGVGQVIAGWDMTVKQMKVGDRVQVTIPYQLAYGPQGSPPKIPPKTDLVFDIELLSVE